MQEAGAGGRCRRQMQEADAGGQMQAADAGGRCRRQMQEANTGGRYRE